MPAMNLLTKKVLCLVSAALVVFALSACGPYTIDDLDRERHAGYEEGYNAGLHDSPSIGDMSDFTQGAYDDGYADGYNDGYENGYESGYENGLAE